MAGKDQPSESGLDAAESLESKYEQTVRDIEQVRKELDNERRNGVPASSGGKSGSSAEQGISKEDFRNQLAERRQAALDAFMEAGETPNKERSKSVPRGRAGSAAGGKGNRSLSTGRGRASELSRTSPTGSSSARSVYDRLFNSSLNTRLKKEVARRHQIEGSGINPKINTVSQAIRRDAPVEDILLRRNEEYKAHIEELRREKEQMELSLLKKPKINRQSKDMHRRDTIGDRYQVYVQQREDKKAKLRQQLLEDEQKKFSHRPVINEKSQKLARSPSSMLEWAENRKKKREQDVERARAEEEAALKSYPTMSEGSRKIMEKVKRYDGRRESSSSLYDRAVAAQTKKLELSQHSSVDNEECTGVPRISAHSANLKRSGNVTERLYKLAMEKVAKQSSSPQPREIPKSAGTARDPGTGQKLYEPFINPRSAVLVREKPVEDRLLEAGQRREARRRALASEQSQKLAHSATAPKMGAYSKVLADLVENRTQQAVSERLQQPIGILKEDTIRDLVNEESTKYTFKPHINETSRLIDQEMHGVGGAESRRQLLFKKAALYDQHLSQLQQDKIREELSECTFVPATPRQRNGSGSQQGMTPLSGGSMHERQLEWARKVEEKVQHERRLAAESREAECTFRPTLSSPKGSANRKQDQHARQLDQSNDLTSSLDDSEVERSYHSSRYSVEVDEASEIRKDELNDLGDADAWLSTLGFGPR